MSFTPSTFWNALIALVAICALWYGSHAAMNVFRYYRLTEQVDVTVDKWSEVSLGRKGRILEAEYHYEIGGQHYEGKAQLKNERFRNSWSAQERIKKLRSQRITAWYDPASPGRSALLRQFPYLSCAYTAVLLALCAYFYWLKRYSAMLG